MNHLGPADPAPRLASGSRARALRFATAPPLRDAEYVWNLARVHGINVNRDYAEVFQVYRLVV